MENDVKMNFLIQRKYNNQKEYEEYLCTWKISRAQVDEYERSTNFEYKKRLERERKEKERKAKAVANKDTVEEKMWQINLEAARRIKGETENKIERPKIITRVLLIDGDNNSDCIEGLNEVKDYFQDIFCWTNNEGLKKKLKPANCQWVFFRRFFMLKNGCT